jgi:hypothetical protein
MTSHLTSTHAQQLNQVNVKIVKCKTGKKCTKRLVLLLAAYIEHGTAGTTATLPRICASSVRESEPPNSHEI